MSTIQSKQAKKGLGKNKLLKILEFAYEKDTFAEAEICEEVGLNHEEFMAYVSGVHRDYTGSDIIQYCKENDESGKARYMISCEAFFNYLEYIELKEARQSSKTAKRLAIVAIFITCVSLLVSICFSKKQIESPIKIEKTQFEKIMTLKSNPN